jgi:hypothetical protein
VSKASLFHCKLRNCADSTDRVLLTRWSVWSPRLNVTCLLFSRTDLRGRRFHEKLGKLVYNFGERFGGRGMYGVELIYDIYWRFLRALVQDIYYLCRNWFLPNVFLIVSTVFRNMWFRVMTKRACMAKEIAF